MTEPNNCHGDIAPLIGKLGSNNASNASTIIVGPAEYRAMLDNVRIWHFAVISDRPLTFRSPSVDFVVSDDLHELDALKTEFIAKVMLAATGRKFRLYTYSTIEEAFIKSEQLWPCEQTRRWCKWIRGPSKPSPIEREGQMNFGRSLWPSHS